MNYQTKKLILLFLVALFYSCNFFSPEKVRERVETGIQTADSALETEYVKTKDTFNLTYKKALQASNDSIVTKRIRKLNEIVIETVNYMDSLKTEMNKLDDADVKNTELIKKIYLTEGIGDSLFNKLKSSYTLAEGIALTNEKKSEVKASRANMLNEPDTDQRKKQYFGLNGPKGIAWMLYGMEIELLKIGIRSLDGYYHR